MINASVLVKATDETSQYQWLLDATSGTTASVDTRSWPIGGGNMKEATYSLYNVEVINGVLQARVHVMFGFAPEFTMELVAPSSVHLTVNKNMLFGVGNVDENLVLTANYFTALQNFFNTAGFPKS